jgi:DNA-binding PadR family transcriptional regulator
MLNVSDTLLRGITKNQIIALMIIAAAGDSGAVGAEIMKDSQGKLKRGTIYGTLQQAERKGFIRSKEINEKKSRHPQRKYFIEEKGRKKVGEITTGLLVGLLESLF